MDLEQQIQTLINEAPSDPNIRLGVRSIAPIIKSIAQTLPLTTYYIPESNAGDWLITTIQNRYQPEQIIDVIYLFANQGDGLKFIQQSLFAGKIVPIPIVKLLFEVSTIESIDRLIFFNKPGDLNQGQEIERSYIQNLINHQLKKTFSQPQINNLPNDIC